MATLETLATHFQETSPWQLFGFELLKVTPGNAELRMNRPEVFLNSRGVVHGGGLATLADACMSMAVKSLIGLVAPTPTVEMKVNYLNPALGHGPLVANATVVHCGTNLAVIRCSILGPDGRQVVEATATFAILKNRPARDKEA